VKRAIGIVLIVLGGLFGLLAVDSSLFMPTRAGLWFPITAAVVSISLVLSGIAVRRASRVAK
jgi:hypothetical protein